MPTWPAPPQARDRHVTPHVTPAGTRPPRDTPRDACRHATAKLARETDHLLEALQGQDEHKGVDWQIVEEESLQ
eukprot:3306717-Prymnesium_polylepis.2